MTGTSSRPRETGTAAASAPNEEYHEAEDEQSDAPPERVTGEEREGERDDAGGEQRPADRGAIGHVDTTVGRRKWLGPVPAARVRPGG